jgi:signal transduction histidine kinase
VNANGQHSNSISRWTTEVFRSLLDSSAPEVAAKAAAASWIVAARATSVSVVLFESSSQYVVARGVCDGDDNIEVSAESAYGSIADLYMPESLAHHCGIQQAAQTVTHLWPERASVCFVESADDTLSDDAARLAARILGQAESQQTIFPSPDHMESMAEFAAGAGHEINNPLGSIIGQTQLLLKQESQMERRQSLGTIGSQAWRIRDMIGDCMLFARPPAVELQETSLGDIVREAATGIAKILEQPVECLEFDLPAMRLTVEVDVTQIKTLIGHLVRNAIEASRDSDSEPQVTVALKPDGNAVLLTVDDAGPGIKERSLRRHLFDPFYSGRQAGRGIGFGLPVCWQIVRSHGGLILTEPSSRGGSRFVVVLPRSR